VALFGLGIRHDPYMAYNFVVEIGGILAGGFTEVSGLESEIQLESYQEGGVNSYIHQFPNHTTSPPLVFSRGLTDIDVLWNWYWAASQGVIVTLNGTIMLMNRQQAPVMWWNFRSAYPVKWVGPQFDASNDTQVAIERLELVHQGLSKPLIPIPS
jgi:phage tail-like protein